MARHHRWFFPGLSLHVIQRGNNRCDIFRSQVDREAFLYALSGACATFRLEIHAYVLMTNHVHLVATPGSQESLAKAMQSVGRHYVPYFNRCYRRTGGLFEARYRADHIHSERYWYNCVRYVELNPVRAGLAVHPEDYKWSSYRVHALGEPDVLVQPHSCYERLADTPTERATIWRGLCSSPLSEDELADIRAPAATLSRPVPGSDPGSDPSLG